MKITQGMAGITGIRSLFVSIALAFQRSEGSKPLRLSDEPPFRDIAPENIRQTARILFCLAAIGVTCRANAWAE